MHIWLPHTLQGPATRRHSAKLHVPSLPNQRAAHVQLSCGRCRRCGLHRTKMAAAAGRSTSRWLRNATPNATSRLAAASAAKPARSSAERTNPLGSRPPHPEVRLQGAEEAFKGVFHISGAGAWGMALTYQAHRLLWVLASTSFF